MLIANHNSHHLPNCKNRLNYALTAGRQLVHKRLIENIFLKSYADENNR